MSRLDPARLRADGGDDEQTGEDEGTDDEETDDAVGFDGAALLERAIVAASVVLVVGTLGFVAWQATVTTPNGVPSASVEAVEPVPGSDGARSQVTVRLDNRRGTGLSTVAVVVRCGDATRSLSFEHVPAGGHRTGTVVCPSDATPDAEVVTWTEA